MTVAASGGDGMQGLSGSLMLVLPEPVFRRVVLPLVALAAGSPLGGALFQMPPESVETVGNTLTVYVWLAGGPLAFLVPEQYLPPWAGTWPPRPSV